MSKIIQSVIEIKADIGMAVKDIKTLFDDLLEKQNQANDQQEKLNKEISDVSKSTKNAEKGIDGMAKGFRGVGLALKAVGIGLVLEAFNLLKDVLGQNQQVADFFSTAIKTLTMMFNDLFGYIQKNIGPVISYFEAIFEDPQAAIEKLGQAIKENMIERFESLIKATGHLGSALSKLFKGDFTGAWDDAKDAAEEMVDVATGVNNAWDKGIKSAKEIGTAIGEYASETWNAAAATVALENSVKIAQARNQGLIEQYDRLAEKQRQIRDDESLTIEERIKANNKLGKVLDEQESKMLAGANLAIQSAKLQYDQNSSVDNYVALIQAQNEKLGVLAQIEGFRSEQKVNEIALQKELNELNQTAIDGEVRRTIESKKFNDSLIRNNLDRLKSEKNTIKEEFNIENKKLEDKKSLYEKGTQLYEDAQQEILDLKLNTDQALIDNERKTNEILLAEKLESLSNLENLQNDQYKKQLEQLQIQNDASIQIETTSKDEKFALLLGGLLQRSLLEEQDFESKTETIAERREIIAQTEYESESARLAAIEQVNQMERELDSQKLASRTAMMDGILALTNQETVLGKTLLLAKQALLARELIMDIKASISKAKKAATDATIAGASAGAEVAAGAAKTVGAAPFPANLPLIAGYAIQGAVIISSVIAAVKKVKGAKAPSPDGGGAGGASATPQANFNMVGKSDSNILANSINNQQTPVVNAVVVAREVTSQQEVDRNSNSNRTIVD